MTTTPADAPLGAHPSGASTVAPIVRTLRLVQHAVLLTLVAVSVGRGRLDGADPWLLGGGALALLLWYAAGLPPSRRVLGLRVPSRWWLAGLVLIWLLLVLVTRESVWVAFSLWLLIGYFLPLREALAGALVVLAAVLLSPLRDGGGLAVADILGPVIGAVVALAISRGQQQLVRVAIERQRLVESLIRAQQEAAVLHDELAAEQRSSGILAERTRLSRDIHDTLAQGFSSILLLARAGQAHTDPERLHDLLGQIESSAVANLTEARRVVGALAPEDLESRGLPAALRRQVDALSEVSGIPTELHVDGDLTALPTATEVALLRTAQGALANVRRHADARRVVVTLTDAGEAVRLDIVDDGRGFDAAGWAARAASPVDGGYGLRAMRSRLRELGGELQVESQPGEGTALSAQLPLGFAVEEGA
ncbi:sensor histidine kinase [Intrasporangium sp.]|uniref:sensor histidine kinase n=1 Tax=Intrasporangium sp. TaxID=1925024 RepID=UPI003221BBF4